MALISGSGRRLPLLRITSGLSWNPMTPRKSPISAFFNSLDRMLRFNCFHSVNNRPRRSIDDFVFTAYLLPRTPRNEELYERPWNGKKPHYVVPEQLLGAVDTSCSKLSLLIRIAMGITRRDYESKSLRYKIYLSSVEAPEKSEY